MPKLGNLFKNKKAMKAAIVVVFAGVLITIFLMLSLILMPQPIIPTFEVIDTNGSWEMQGTIAVFDDKIQPGAEGSYDFIVKNETETSLRYGINLAEYLHNINQEAHPFMEYRLSVSGVMLGEDVAYVPAGKIDYYGVIIEPGSEQRFTLEWRWPFEIDDEHNENDTLIGITGGKLSIVCYISAEVTEEAW